MAVLYITEQGSVVRKTGERLIVEKRGEVLSEIPCQKLTAVLIFGNVQVMRRKRPCQSGGIATLRGASRRGRSLRSEKTLPVRWDCDLRCGTAVAQPTCHPSEKTLPVRWDCDGFQNIGEESGCEGRKGFCQSGGIATLPEVEQPMRLC